MLFMMFLRFGKKVQLLMGRIGKKLKRTGRGGGDFNSKMGIVPVEWLCSKRRYAALKAGMRRRIRNRHA